MMTKIIRPSTFENRFDLVSDRFKQDIYNQCRSFSQRNHLLQSSKRDNEHGLYLQMATSYLLLQ